MELTADDARRIGDYIKYQLDKKDGRDRQLELQKKICTIRFHESGNEITINLSFREKTQDELREGVPYSKKLNNN